MMETNDGLVSADEAQRLLDGREAKGAWRAGVDHVYAGHDTCPRHRGDAANQRIRCECRTVASVYTAGDRALCAAAPDLARTVLALAAERDAALAAARKADAQRGLALLDARNAEASERSAREELTRAAEKIAALREIIEGRTTPPTPEELAAHAVAGGSWLYRSSGRWPVTREVSDLGVNCDASRLAESCRELSPDEEPGRWWSRDVAGLLCAWPRVQP